MSQNLISLALDDATLAGIDAALDAAALSLSAAAPPLLWRHRDIRAWPPPENSGDAGVQSGAHG